MRQRRMRVIDRIVRDIEAYGRPVRRAEITAMCHPRTLDRAVARGSLTRLAPGLYASTSTARLPTMRISAAAAWMPSRAHIAGGAALHLWGIEGHLGDTVSIGSAPSDSGPAPRGMRLWRSRALVRTALVGGIRTASVADAFIQWWCLRERPLTEGPALDILRDGRVNARHAQAALARHPRVPSRALLSRLLHEFAGGVHSSLELRARRDVFAGKRWERWERQGAVTVGARTVRVDMLHREARIAVEFDGARFHGDDPQRRRDLERDALLAGAGFTTMRFTWEDITQRPQWCMARVLEALRARGVTP